MIFSDDNPKETPTATDIQNAFSDRGGLVKAKQVFGNTLNETLTDLSETLMG